MAAITTERLGGRIRSPPAAPASKRLVPRKFLSERPNPDLSPRRGSTGQPTPLRACRQQELSACFYAQEPSAVLRNRAHRGGTKPFLRTRQIRRCQNFAKHRHSRQRCSIILCLGVCSSQTTARRSHTVHNRGQARGKESKPQQNPGKYRHNQHRRKSSSRRRTGTATAERTRSARR